MSSTRTGPCNNERNRVSGPQQQWRGISGEREVLPCYDTLFLSFKIKDECEWNKQQTINFILGHSEQSSALSWFHQEFWHEPCKIGKKNWTVRVKTRKVNHIIAHHKTCVTPPLEPVRPSTLITWASLGWSPCEEVDSKISSQTLNWNPRKLHLRRSSLLNSVKHWTSNSTLVWTLNCLLIELNIEHQYIYPTNQEITPS